MSTKTMKQRIAVVAVSALTAGLFSVVSAPVANAADTALYLGANSSLGATMSATKASNTSSGLLAGSGDISATDTASMVAGGTLGLHSTAGDGYSVLTVSGGTITAASGATVTTAITVNTSRTIAGTASTAVGQYQVVPNAGVTGMTIRLYDAATAATASTGGTLVATLLVSIGTYASIGKFSPADSFISVVSTAVSAAHNSNSDTANANVEANGGEGIIALSAFDGNGTALGATNVITASATNGALVAFTSGGQLGSTATDTHGTYDNIYVVQGAANVGQSTTVTVSVDGVVWAAKTFLFYGAVSSITLSSASVGQKSGNGAFYLAVRDNNGSLLASVTPTADSSLYNSSVTSVTPAASSATAVTAQAFACSAIEGTGKIQYSHVNAAAVKISSNILDVSCAGDPATYTASFDKASYVPGDIATLTITAKDSKGNLTNGTATLGTASTYEIAIAGSNMTAVSAPTNADKFTTSAGTKSYKFIVGSTEGSYQMVVNLPQWNSTTYSQSAIAVGYKIAASSATVSNADVLKAIVSLIASINKQIAALQKALLRR
jgi:hypothetical protein